MKNRIKNFFPSLTFSYSLLTSFLPLSYLLLPFLTLFAVSVATAQIPSSGLVGYWPFNGNANDESGNGNSGTVNGATLTTDRFGNANSAYNFNSNAYIRVPFSSSINSIQNGFTMSAWVLMDGGTVAPRVLELRGAYDGGGDAGFGMLSHTNNNSSRPMEVRWYNNYGNTNISVYPSQEVSALSWHHLLFTCNGTLGVGDFYVDGLLVNTNNVIGDQGPINSCNYNFNDLFIGAEPNLATFWGGLIDDIAIYNRALTPAEITQLYTDQTSTVATPPCPTLATNLQTGLVGYWPFCGNANDESGNGNNGTVNGATLTTDRFGNANSAYVFSGGANISVPHNANQNISSVGTWSAWVDASSFPAAGTTSQLISKYNSNLNQRSYVLELELSKFKQNVHDGITWHSVTSATSMQINEWRQVTVVFDKTASPSLKLYLDGTLSATDDSYHGDLPIHSLPIIFGNSSGIALASFNGKMDDVCIWNRALTPSEITQIFTDPSVELPPCPTLAANLQTGLVGYWPFCGNANDESGNGNNGTVNGATLTTDRFGNANSAYSFDGVNDFIEVLHSSSLSFPNNTQTISFWIEIQSSPTPQVLESVMSKYAGSGGSLTGFTMHFTSESLFYSILNGAASNTWGDCFFNTSDLSPYGTYRHVVFSNDNDSLRCYVNGLHVNSTNLANSTITIGQNIFPLVFGKENLMAYAGGLSYFNGKLDDICIWDRALTPTEITQLYTDPSTAPPVACTPFLGEDQTVCAGTSVTLSASGSSLACPTLPATLQNGLVGYWPFCGNANDASGNGNNGTVNGATLTTDRFGNANSAYSFDGNDGIDCGNSSMLDLTSNYSVAYWYQKNGSDMGAVLSKNNGAGGQNKYVLGVNQYGSNGDFCHWHNGPAPQWRYTGIPIDAQWNFILWKFNGQTIELYKNGVFVQSFLLDPTFPQISANMIIGNTEGIMFWNGKIDELMMFNRQLSQEEIQQLYTLGQSTYLWSTGATTATINVTPTTTTTYTCTVTDANGNVCTDSVTVFVPQIEATDLTICAGETTTLSVSGINSVASPSGCPTLPANLQNGLVGYWPFCGNANDASGNGNNGTVNGATLSTDRFGNANSAYSFDGENDGIITPDYNFPYGNSNRTMSFWMKNENTGNSCSVPVRYGIHSNSSAMWILHNNSCNPLYAYGSVVVDFYNNFLVSQTTVPNNEWHFISVTTQGQSCKLYIDGILQGETTTSFSTISSNGSFYIGADLVTPGGLFFNGLIDDVSIYNRALSATEIQQLYTLGQSTYLWSTGATTATINVTPTTTTTYTCTVTTNGVSCTDSVTVVVNNPVIDLGADVTVCGTSTTLTAPSGYDSYLWSNGGTTNTTTVSANGTYSCTATQGGCSATDAVDVTLINASVSASDSTICAGQTITLSVPQGGSSNTACSALPTNLQTGLVGYWPFCGNANDASGNGNNGTVNGATLTTDRFGNANSAYSFDGVNDRISISHNQALSPSIVTVSLWFNASTFLNTDGNQSQLVSKREFSGWGSAYELGIGKMPPEYLNSSTNTLYTNYTTSNNNYTKHYSSSGLTVNDWHQAAYSHDGQYVKFYIDGILVHETPSNGVLSDPGQLPLWFGGRPGGIGRSFYNGLLDEIAIYNRVLTASEIQALYISGQTTYLWFNGATTPTINVSPTSTATYTCTVTTNGVSCTDSVTVVVSNPVIDLGADVTVCGTSTTLTAPSGYDSYLWSNGGTANTTTVTANGTYSCAVTQGGCSATDAVDVTLINASVSASDSTICAGQTITLSVPQGGSSNTACSALPTNLQTGLVGYWPFCGNANDASGNGNNGTVNGATLTTDRFGNANSAYAFNVNSLTSIGISNLNGLSDWSIAFWCNPSSSNTSFLYYPIGINCQLYWKGIGLSGNNPPCGIPSQNLFLFDGSQGCSNWFAANSVFNYNGFNQFVITKSGLEYRIYQNGTLLNSSSSLEAISIQSLTLGRRCNDPSTNTLDGTIDDVILHNRALTTNEIQQLYNLGQTTYLWSNGATTPTVNVSPTSTTTYTCTVTTNGVSCTDSVTVVVSNPVIDLGADVTVCGTSTTLTAPSGYDSYLWSNGGTTNTTTVSANGTYSCTATQGGCSATDAVDVTLVNATVSASDSTICAGQSVTLSLPQGALTTTACATLPTNLQTGLVGYWPFCGNANDASGNGNNGTVNGATLTTDRFGNANSAYSFDGNDWIESLIPQTLGYTVSGWVFLNTNSNYNGFAQHKNNCGRGGGYILGIPNGGDVRLLRQNCGECGNNCGAEFSISNFSNVGIGEWKHLVATCDAINSHKVYLNGQLVYTQTNSSSIGQYGQQLFSIGKHHDSPDLYFLNGKADDFLLYNRALTAAEIQQLFTLGQTTYLWSNGATTPTINVSPSSTTTYTCTVTTNGVSCTDNITVVVSQPVASITPNGIVEICQGQSIALTANGGVSYLWNTGAPTQSITVNTEAVYSVTVTDANGCTDTESQLVKLNQLPNIGVNNASVCPGQSTTLTATGGLSYLWSPATGLSSTTGTTVTASPSTSTVYTVTGTGANGCTNTAIAAVTVNALPTATITPATATTFCQGGSVVLNANAGTGLTYQWRLNGTNITGATLSSYTANASGSYTVVVTNASTCSATSTATVVTVNALPTATITPATTTTFCQGGSVVLNANTGTGLSYQWFNNTAAISGATTSSYTANASGSYTVVVTNTSTCSSTSMATVVTVNALPTATITSSSATTFCQGGSVVLNANTGTGLTYQWRLNGTNITGATTSTYTANASGSYTVVVTNTSTCSATSTATVVTVNALPTATITAATTTTFCQGGSVVLTANTGTGLSYQWRLNGTNITGATTSTYTANASGSYTVVVTNTSTCSSTSTATVVTVNALPTATITSATATTFCQGGSVVLNANTGTGLSYQWYNNAVIISGATSASYPVNASGSYTVVVTNTSTCSATSTATVVTVNALPTATITPATTTTFCQGGSVVLTANTGTGLSYQWRLNGTNITGATSSSYTANASGSYTVVVTNTSTCSATSAATVVTVNALPTATITTATATTFCQGGSVVLNANTGSGLTYQWRLNGTNITGATSSTYTANASGSYTVVVTNTSTCSATSMATVVTVNALPTATITTSSATTFCQGGSVVLTANTGTGLSYQWRLNGTNITGATTSSYTANASGSYTVVVTNTSTCSATSTATVVTVNALPTATITPATATTFCQGGSVVLTANTGAGLTYQWKLNGTNITGATTSSYTANASGSYTVVVTNTSTCSSTSTATVVTVNALPTATITASSATTFCQGGSVVLTANTGTGLSYQWFNNAVAISGATSSSYTANSSGSYTVVVTNTSTCSATSTAIVVTVNALPTATITTATATTFCQGGSVVLTANTGTGLTYQWRLNGTNITGATSSSYNANASGSYTVVVTNTSTCSATSAATVVTVNALPTATITPATATTFCQGGSVVLNANTGTGLTYQWRLNSTNITGATLSSYTANASGSYTVVVTNTSTCSATSTATVVTVNALPAATITASSATTFCQGGSVVLSANTGTGLTYQWFNNAVVISGATSSSYTANTSGSYTVVVTNTSTCSATSTAIDVTAVPNVNYYADADGDGFGDVTTLISTCVQPQGYVTDNTDCNDNDASIYPGAQEICNDVDDDCNDLIDDGLVFTTYYADADGDSFGDVNNPLDACLIPDGYVTDNTDCNDNNANQSVASIEICNGEDDDCDGTIDNGLIFLDYYADLDSDGFGAGAATNSCVDLGAGYVTNNTDCNNANALINPNATEICNSIDDNCDGQIDEGIVFTTYYQDFDNDGFGTGDALTSCTNPGAGWVTNNTDCDDTNGNTNPNATETCNTIDDNCDGQIDEGVQTVYFIDNDGDTYGNPSVSILACTQPTGYTPDDTDCNDNAPNINPGAEDIGGNGIDENCDGEIDNSIFELNATISLYPNPTHFELNIQVNSSVIGSDVYIFDAVGQLVYKQQLLSTQTTIPVSNFADGNYVLRLGEVVKRFVVEK